jgi:hypothetical protein
MPPVRRSAGRKSPDHNRLAFSYVLIRLPVVNEMIEISRPSRYSEPPQTGTVEFSPDVGDAAMPRSTYFVQECPTCGRNLQVRVEYLGKPVECQHCHAGFLASEPGSNEYPAGESGVSLLERAEQLLQSASLAASSAPDYTTDVMPVRPK